MLINVNCIRRTPAALLRKAGLSAAVLSLSLANAFAAPAFDQPDADFRGSLNAAGVVYAGTEAQLAGRGFTPGQEVILLQNGHTLTPQALVADKEGNLSTTVAIPAEAAVGVHPVVMQVSKPSTAGIFNLKVSPKVELSGQDKFELQSQHLVPGLYQSAYSPKNKVLFVTSAVGRPPVKQSQLVKVNPKTLAVEASVTPAAQKGRDDGQVQAVYGVDVDDKQGNVWVTNTRSSSVAVYSQKDLKLVKQFEDGVVSHPRDVVVDEKADRAYVSSPGADTLAVFDTKKLTQLDPIELQSKTRNKPGSMSLVLDAEKDRLYTVSASTNELIIVDLKNDNAQTVFPVPGARGLAGVSVDSKNDQVYITAQGSDNLLILNAKDGSVQHDIKIGAGALNVVFDPKTSLAYVASRGAGTVTAVNGKGEIVANLDGGSFPNHVSLDGEGNAYLVNKSKGKDDQTADRITRLHLK
ncbi:YncE family protein [Alcaligenes faecalis]|uniref:YncE family protein n=1 Tax=Alcaligenes faecalis TaxID=511 RepID=UPI00137BA28C|nr:YncE family protein [Alcaligenes faecalis]QHS34842.1 YncE family protein [Alcaligenes faecalis]